MRMSDFGKEITEGFMCSCAAERSGELKNIGEEVNLVRIISHFVLCFDESTVRLQFTTIVRLDLRFTAFKLNQMG